MEFINEELQMNNAQKWYENEYSQDTESAQRKWPNEELARFIGRTYGDVSIHQRKEVSILEVGCGSGANIRLLIEEGFDVYGLDFSPTAIDYCRKRYPNGQYTIADMTNTPYENCCFDCIVDVFSAYCFDRLTFENSFLHEIYRILKPGGRFFSYTPSLNSDAWKIHAPAEKLDDRTLR